MITLLVQLESAAKFVQETVEALVHRSLSFLLAFWEYRSSIRVSQGNKIFFHFTN